MNFLVKRIVMLSVITSTCRGQIDTNINVSGFDISKDDKELLIAYQPQKNRSIYKVDLKNNTAKLIVAGNDNLDFFNPQYSNNGKKISFVGYFNKNKNNSAVFVCNPDGTDLKQITKGNEIIKQAIFSKFDTSIVLYTKANAYENYSSFAPKQAHKMDIYSVNLKDTSISKLTNMNAYGIYEISELDSINLLMHLPGGKEGGMFLYNKKTMEKHRIVPVNDPRNDPSFYYTPKYSYKFNTLGIIAPYELYIMDLATKIATRVYRSGSDLKQVHDFCFFYNQKRIIFKAGKDGLFLINYDGTDLKKLKFKVIED